MKHEKVYLVRFKDNWDDEMDIDGHVVLTGKDKDYLLKSIEKLTNRGELLISIGTNEDLRYDDGSDLLECFTFKVLDDVDLVTLVKLDLLSCGFAESIINQICEYED
jgi:hypothetical protein